MTILKEIAIKRNENQEQGYESILFMSEQSINRLINEVDSVIGDVIYGMNINFCEEGWEVRRIPKPYKLQLRYC